MTDASTDAPATESASAPSPPRRPGKGPGCRTLVLGGAVMLVAAVALGWWRWNVSKQEALVQQEQRAQQAFDPVLRQMGLSAEAAPQGPAYDLDTTVKVIHEIDLAVTQSESLDEWLKELARQDYRDVAPEVLEARMEMMDILMRLYAKQTDLEDQQALWEMSSGLMMLTALSVVQVEGEVDPLMPGGSFSVDRDQAQKMLQDSLDRQDAHGEMLKDVREVEAELLNAMVKYSTVYYQYLEEWDRLCTLRDRAYLAASNEDWATVEEAAGAAIEMAPKEREAHLLKALALVEGGHSPERAEEALAVLSEYSEEHPDSTAPALLLMGVVEGQRGDFGAAQLHLQQSATYYPKQADQLSDMLDPYRQRGFLRKSREGGLIIELYKSTMLGAGTFSPDLQLAKLLFAQGDFEAGRKKVMDHFARRRAQQQWDFIISDLRYCHEMLGEDYYRIFPEHDYLDLEVSPGMFGSKLNLKVNNRSDRTLHNATLVLALQFTDMHPADYETFVGGETQPAVVALSATDFGQAEIAFDLHGVTKSVDDIVTHRAILVSNEAVTWVDTDEYKIAEAKEFRQQVKAEQKQGGAVTSTAGSWQERLTRSVIADTRKEAKMSVEKQFLKDDVSISLPKELALLAPIFRLKGPDGQLLAANKNIIKGDTIQLGFADVLELDDGGGEVELVASTPYGDVALTWRVAMDGTVWLQDVGLQSP